MSRLLVICRRAPYGNSLAREALDVALAAAAFDLDVSLLFVDDGVLQLLDEQHGAAIGRKNHLAALKVLPLYDITGVYVDQLSLRQRGIEHTQLGVPATVLAADTLAEFSRNFDRVLNF